VIEDGGFPPLLSDYLQEKLSKAEHGIKQPHVKAILDEIGEDLRNEDPLSNIMPWFANGVDRADGRLYLGINWLAPWRKKLKLNWPNDSVALVEAIIAMHKKLSQVTK
jgi:cholesterol oxidase